MRIRKAKKEDFEDYYQMKKQEAIVYTKMLKDKIKSPPRKKLNEDFMNSLKSKKEFVLIAEEDETCGYIRFDIFASPAMKGVFISDLFVIDKFRGKGIATKLIKACLKIAKEKKAKKVLLGVLVNNKKALNLYEKLGFKINRYEMERKLK